MKCLVSDLMKQKKNNWIGKNGPLLIAEVGGNHEGSFSYAKKTLLN